MYSVFTGASVELSALSDRHQAVPRILSFTSRTEGWRFGRGKKPGLDMLIRALAIANALNRIGIPKTGAFLEENGSILVTGYFSEGRHLEVMCLKDGKYELSFEKDGEDIFGGMHQTITDVEAEIIRQVESWGQTTNLSAYSILTTTTSNLTGSAALVIPTTVYPCFVPSAQSFTTGQSVSISEKPSEQLQASPRSFGSLSAVNFQINHVSRT